jgi:hypothetical protein
MAIDRILGLLQDSELINANQREAHRDWLQNNYSNSAEALSEVLGYLHDAHPSLLTQGNYDVVLEMAVDAKFLANGLEYLRNAANSDNLLVQVIITALLQRAKYADSLAKIFI